MASGAGDLIAWEGPAIGLLDLDAFFASVEQLDHPEWRGRPLIVGGSPERRGVVSTASYEARAFGVHSAMPAWQAKRLCPQAIWTHGHFDRYREVSAQVMALIGRETPLVEQMSIDEAFFDVSPGRYSRESPVAICRRLQGRVAQLGVTCSIGLGTSKTVAKVASERQKPRGLTVVPPGTEASFLAPLPVRALSGVGASTEARLESLGIRTLGQLAQADPDRLERIMGVVGPSLVARAAGLEHSPVRAQDSPEEAKSVSNERTFARDLTTTAELEGAVLMVSALVGERLRRKGLKGSQVTLKLKFSVSSGRTIQCRLRGATDDEHEFGPVAVGLLYQVWHEGVPVRLVGVGMSGLGEGLEEGQGEQLTLFGNDDQPVQPQADDERRAELRRLSAATDAVRERFGRDALGYGRDLRFRDETSDTSPRDRQDGG